MFSEETDQTICYDIQKVSGYLEEAELQSTEWDIVTRRGR